MPETAAARTAAALKRAGTQSLLALPVGVLAGIASAVFLAALDKATRVRWDNPWLLLLLPAAGAFVVWVYERHGRDSGAGNNLILENIHAPGGGVPARMAPFVLAGTLITHLFGGSAGREGTAVQMGGSLAGFYARVCRFGAENRRVALIAGVAAGFGSVFGTPLAGAVFAIEVLVIGRLHFAAFIPALVASFTGDLVCHALGAHHTAYHIALIPDNPLPFALSWTLLAKTFAAAIVFGLVGRAFAEATHLAGDGLKKLSKSGPVRAALGGALVLAIAAALGTDDYLGIGVTSHHPHGVSLTAAFLPGGATTWSWFWKLLLTAVTLGAGFKGGEVTPLFFVGATLGNTFAVLAGAPVDLFAGLGFLAVFAGAANTPLACAIMGVELFGGHYAAYFALACFVAYRVSGHGGIYHAQRVGSPKHPWARGHAGRSLREIRDKRR